MRLTIMQPAYWPWLGWFHRVAISDMLIILDNVQIDLNSRTKFANRNKIRTKDGWQWITVPLKTKGKFGNLYLNHIEVENNQRWREKHLSVIRHNYSKALFFKRHETYLMDLYSRKWKLLTEVANETTRYLLDALQIKTPLLSSSEMNVSGQKDEFLLNLCKAAGADTYISGPFGRTYIRENLFEASGIKVLYHDYKHPVYPQTYERFESFMSAIDLLMNCGDTSKNILMGEEGIL
ncbi:WbqC family protein [uncultured Candidatus Kuenenia sp.]|uniref:WbqC family protein n=1 Tax=uncultured Candidatus Kuenenia sp. TaxID=1048336 RepID=UPI000310375D|nr:WbqC family protein [uncultured Candidatus Kuenenia sp.]